MRARARARSDDTPFHGETQQRFVTGTRAIARDRLGSMNRALVKVLVVEDDVEAAASFSLTLTDFGYDVRVATNAAGAVLAVRNFVPDVVVLDLGLPDRDGEDLAQELRATLPMRAPIVVVTGRPGTRPESLRAIDVIVRKPVDGKLFTSLISCARAKRASLRD